HSGRSIRGVRELPGGNAAEAAGSRAMGEALHFLSGEDGTRAVVGNRHPTGFFGQSPLTQSFTLSVIPSFISKKRSVEFFTTWEKSHVANATLSGTVCGLG